MILNYHNKDDVPHKKSWFSSHVTHDIHFGLFMFDCGEWLWGSFVFADDMFINRELLFVHEGIHVDGGDVDRIVQQLDLSLRPVRSHL